MYCSTNIRQRRRSNRRGQALVEFAVVALAIYLLLAAVLTFGRILYCAQGVQQAADIAARELSRTPLPADASFEEALTDSGVCSRIFNERYLVLAIDPDSSPLTFNGGHSLAEFPLVNQQLVPLMIYDELGGQRVLRYPGAVFTDPSPNPNLNLPASGYLVRVPVVAAQTGQIVWLPVLEEVRSASNPDPFPVSSPQRGLVALRINYPYQAEAMSGFHRVPDPGTTGPVDPIIADDSVAASDPIGVGSPVESDLSIGDRGLGPYAGQYGLGQQAAWAQTVRPYRRVISAQAIFRREVFQ